MGRSVAWSRGVAAGLSGISLMLACPARADGAGGAGSAGSEDRAPPSASGAIEQSERLRRLDIMLMVTGLRCRATRYDFQDDFQAFEARHLADLNAATQALARQFAAQSTAEEAGRQVDRLSVQMANRYGNGHPWLGCRELKGLAQALAAQDGRDVLLQAAGETLDGDEPAPLPVATVAVAAR